MSLGLRGKIQFLVEAKGFQCTKGLHPEILPTEEGKSDLLFCHCLLVFYLLSDNESKVLERVVFGPEVLVDFDRVLLLRIVSMLVYSSIGLLGFQLTNVLLAIEATIAPGEVNCIF